MATFHSIVGKLFFVGKRARSDIMVAIFPSIQELASLMTTIEKVRKTDVLCQ